MQPTQLPTPSPLTALTQLPAMALEPHLMKTINYVSDNKDESDPLSKGYKSSNSKEMDEDDWDMFESCTYDKAKE